MLQTLEPGQLPVVKDDEERILGDIILGVPYIYNSCLQNSEHLDEILPVRMSNFLTPVIAVSVHLSIRFQMRRFLVIDQLEKKIACGGHVFNESGQN